MIDLILVYKDGARSRAFLNPAHIVWMRDESVEDSRAILHSTVDDQETVCRVELANGSVLYACHDAEQIDEAVMLCVQNPGNTYSPD